MFFWKFPWVISGELPEELTSNTGGIFEELLQKFSRNCRITSKKIPDELPEEFPRSSFPKSRGTSGGVPEELLGKYSKNSWRNSRGSCGYIFEELLEEFPRNSGEISKNLKKKKF